MLQGSRSPKFSFILKHPEIPSMSIDTFKVAKVFEIFIKKHGIYKCQI